MLSGHEDLTSREVNGIQVLKLARRHPDVAWKCVCRNCGCEQTHLHRHFQTGLIACKNSTCKNRRVKVAPAKTVDLHPPDRSPIAKVKGRWEW
jgi:hypothetical protein